MTERYGRPSEIRSAALALGLDDSTAGVLRAFERAGVSSVVLRGPAIARWLCEPGERRHYSDVDLLVPPPHWEAAQRVLAELGFVAGGELLPTPWWNTHAIEWGHPEYYAAVDLHYTLQGVGVEPARLWSSLSGRTETLDVGGYPATVLTIPGRALTLALHACQHAGGHPMGELGRALARTDEATWRAAAALAAEVDATDAFATGLRLADGGPALADRLGLPSEMPTEIALAPGWAPSGALTIERFARAGMRRRLAMIRYAVAPPRSFLRGWLSSDFTTRRALAGAYVERARWSVRLAPAALRAWIRVRRAARADRKRPL
jgi:hypothetical protein